MNPIVHRGHAKARSPLSPIARCRDVKRRPTTATAQALRPVAVLSSHRSERNAICRPTTTTAAIRSSAPTMHLPRAHTRRRGHIPHRAAAIQHRHAPTPHLAAAIAVEVAAGAVVLAVAVAAAEIAAAAVVEEARTAAEAPALTRGTNLFAKTIVRPHLSDGLSVFRHQLELKFSQPRIS